MFYKQYISVPNLKKCNNSHILNDDHIDKKHKHLAALNTIWLISFTTSFLPSKLSSFALFEFSSELLSSLSSITKDGCTFCLFSWAKNFHILIHDNRKDQKNYLLFSTLCLLQSYVFDKIKKIKWKICISFSNSYWIWFDTSAHIKYAI